MSTTMILLLGACSWGVILLVGWVVDDATRYRGKRVALSDVEAWTSQAPRLARSAPLEEQLVSFPVGHPEQAVVVPDVFQGRTEEMPVVETPVVHVEVTEEIGLDGLLDDRPSAELAEPTEAERRFGELWDNALWENEVFDSRCRHDAAMQQFRGGRHRVEDLIDAWLREDGRLPGLADARRAAFPDCEDPSVEISLEDLEAARAGAR